MSTPDDDTRISRRAAATGQGAEPDDDTRVSARNTAPVDEDTRVRDRPAPPVDEDTPVAGRRARRPAADATGAVRRGPADDDRTRITKRPARRAAADDDTLVSARAARHEEEDATAVSRVRPVGRPAGRQPAPTAVAAPLRVPAVRSTPPAGERLPDPEPGDGGAAARAARLRALRVQLLVLAGGTLVLMAGAVAGIVALIAW